MLVFLLPIDFNVSIVFFHKIPILYVLTPIPNLPLTIKYTNLLVDPPD